MIITVQELMDRYKVSRATVYRWLDKGFPVIRIGKVVRFNTDETDEWVKAEGKPQEQ